MKRFCRDNPAERLGYQKDGIVDIKKHKWFQVRSGISDRGNVITFKFLNFLSLQGFDWAGLLDRSLGPPLLPTVEVSVLDQICFSNKKTCQLMTYLSLNFQSCNDATNFDQFPRDTSVPPDETSGWDAAF